MGLCDPHVHTTFSDGRHSPIEVVDHACRVPGLDLIAVTDHDCLEGALQAAAYAESHCLPVRVVPGEEVTSRDGHVVGLFLGELVAPGMSAAETIRAIHEQRGLAVAVHPCRSKGVGRLAETLPFDAVELVNGAPTPRSRAGNRSALRLRIGDRAATGGSDAHIKEMLASSGTAFAGASPADFRQAVLGGLTRPVGRPANLVPYLRYACGRLVRHPAALRELWPG